MAEETDPGRRTERAREEHREKEKEREKGEGLLRGGQAPKRIPQA